MQQQVSGGAPPPASSGRARWPTVRDAILPWTPAALALAAFAVALVSQFSFTDLDGFISKPWRGFMVAVGLFGASVIALRRVWGARADEAEQAFVLPRNVEVGLVAAVFALAAFFRFWDFQDFPPGLWYDEAVNGTDAFSIMDRDHLTVWRSSNFGHSTIYFYLLLASFKVFGYTVTAMRMVPALAGLAAVFGFYFLARWLLGPIPALVTTALMAVSRWAVTFSRVSWEASLQPLLEVMAVFFFVKALEKRTNWFYWFMAGGSLAAGIYTYLAFRFVPIVMAFFIAYIAATKWRVLWNNRIGLVVYAVSFLVVIAPLGQFALRNQDLFLERTREINIFNEIDERDSYQPLKDNLRKSAEMMNVAGDLNGRHNLPGEPMLDEVSAALLVLGFAAAVWSFKNWKKGTVAGWYILALLPGAFTISIENPSAIRTVGAIPPLFLLVGLAVATIYRPLAVTRRGVWVFGALVAVIIPAAAAINFYDLYERQAKNEAVYAGFQPEFTQVGRVIAANADDKRVLATRQFSSHQAVTVLTRGKTWEPFNLPQQFILPRGDKDILLILDVDQFALIPVLQTLYPNMTQDDYVDPFERVFFTRLTIPRADIEALHALQVEITRDGGASEMTSAPLDRTWTEEDLGDGPIDVRWQGYMWHAAATSGSFLIQSPGGTASLFIDGQEMSVDASGQSALIQLDFGEHRIEVRARITQPGRLAAQWSSTTQGAVELADAAYAKSAGEQGFQVVFRSGSDFASQVGGQGRVPFPVPLPAVGGARAIEYVGVLTLPRDGIYGFALTGASPAQLFVDGDLVVDAGGSHGRVRIASEIELDSGEHTISIQYMAQADPNWELSVRPVPSEGEAEYERVAAVDVSVPEGPYRPPAIVMIAPDPAWAAGRDVPDVTQPNGIASLPDGTIAVGGGDTVAILDAGGSTLRSFRPAGATQIVDLDATDDGRLVVLDNASATLLLVDAGTGDVTATLGGGGAFASAWGVGVQGDTAYVASPNGGFLYVVPLDGGDITNLPVAEPVSPVRALQPSDIARGEDGAYYIADFEGKAIIKSIDGRQGEKIRGVNGTGAQLPKIAVSGKLIFLSDPIARRVLVYDINGRQRGAYTFPSGEAHPLGLALLPDGSLLAADLSGRVHKLDITIPPGTQAELDAIGTEPEVAEADPDVTP